MPKNSNSNCRVSVKICRNMIIVLLVDRRTKKNLATYYISLHNLKLPQHTEMLSFLAFKSNPNFNKYSESMLLLSSIKKIQINIHISYKNTYLYNMHAYSCITSLAQGDTCVCGLVNDLRQQHFKRHKVKIICFLYVSSYMCRT